MYSVVPLKPGQVAIFLEVALVASHGTSSKDCPVGLAIRKANKLALETAPSKLEAKKAAEDASAEEESKCLAIEAVGKGGKSYEGASAGYVV